MPPAGFQPTYLTVQQHDDVLIAAFTKSQLTEEENIGLLEQELFGLIEQFPCRKLIVNLDQVVHITSIVVGKLITLHRRLHRSDGTLVLCSLRNSVEEIFTTSRLINYFNIAENVDGALAMLQSS